MSLELFSLASVCQILYIWQLRPLYSLIGSDGGTEIYLSDSARTKDPKDKLPLFGGMSTNGERWPALDQRACESESQTLICRGTCTLLEYFHFVLLHTSNPPHFRGNIVLLYSTTYI